MAGRRPKPTKLKELAGNPGHRTLNNAEPRPGGIPACPTHLDREARAEWKRIARELTGLGLLTSVDRAALAAYCAAYSRWVKAEEQVQKFGLVIKSPKSGYPIANPYVGIANTALDQMRRFLIEFGMTPASRSRIHVDAPGEEDPFDAFMKELDNQPVADERNDDKQGRTVYQ